MKKSELHAISLEKLHFNNPDSVLIVKILISILTILEDIEERTPDDN